MMDMVLLGVVACGAFGIGALLIWILRTRELHALTASLAPLDAELESLRATARDLEATRKDNIELEKQLSAAGARAESLSSLDVELAAARQRITELTADGARLNANLESATVAHAEQVEHLTRMRQEVQDQFKLLAGDVLKASNEEFAVRAEAIFKAQKESTSAEIDKRSESIALMIKPIGDSLQAYDIALKAIEKERIESFAGITEALKTVTSQQGEVRLVTANLVNALRASPKTRGRWGEETLRRVMEMSGMVEHCDFETEKHFRGEDESLRPDVLINLSGGRVIVVDAKAPVSAYLDAIAATSEEEREVLLKRHAFQLRERLTNLSSKSYWEKIEGSPDCVVMFVPGDNFVAAAFERDPDLFEDGIKNRVLVCTPTTFIALAKAISYGWRQESLAKNAEQVGRLGKELYQRLATLGSYVRDMGTHLGRATGKYNQFVGSLESSVMPQARRFQELGVEGTAEPLPETPRVDVVVRFPQPNRDLLIAESGEKDA